MAGEAGGGAAAAAFDGSIQNALGSWAPGEEIKPLLISEGWPPVKEKYIADVAAQIFASNDCPPGQETAKAWRALNMAEQLYNALHSKNYI